MALWGTSGAIVIVGSSAGLALDCRQPVGDSPLPQVDRGQTSVNLVDWIAGGCLESSNVSDTAAMFELAVSSSES